MNNKQLKIHYLLPPTTIRISSVEAVLHGDSRPERYLFYGLDFFQSRGFTVSHNIFIPSKYSNLLTVICRKLFTRFGVYTTYLEWILGSWKELRKSNVIIVYSDRMMISLNFLRLLHLRPRRPIIFISMGLPEKFVYLNNRVLFRTLNEFKKVDKIVCLSKEEKEILDKEYGLKDNVEFIQTGVDTHYFFPKQSGIHTDILSIGGDKYRDFSTLIKAASNLPEIKFTIITNKIMAEKIKPILPNVRIITDVPITAIRDHLASCRMVVLPIIDNIYSGATTVMLQAMALGKPVIGNKIGPNREGYGFIDGENCIFVEPQKENELNQVIKIVYHDLELQERLGKAARQHVEANLNIEKFHNRLLKIVKELCQL
jgi:glycosyltransferase involved in cell wall biosynthesis